MAAPERSPRVEREFRRPYTPTLEQARAFAEAGYKIIPLYQTLPADLETPGRIYLKLSQERPRNQWGPAFLFESVEVGEKLGRYSYIGVNPKRGIEVLSEPGWIERTPTSATLHDQDLVDEEGNPKLTDPLVILERLMPEKDSIAPVSGLPPFFGGFVGFLGYECIKRWEPTVPIHPNTLGIPDSIFFEPGELVVYDHIQQRMKVVTNIEIENPQEIDEKYPAAQDRINNIVEVLSNPLDPAFENLTLTSEQETKEVVSNFTPEEYVAMVEDIIEKHILEGDVFQIVTSQRLSIETSDDSFVIYRRQRQGNPSFLMYFIDFTDRTESDPLEFQLIGASPEISSMLIGNKIVSRPLAGTRPRGFKINEDGSIDFENIDPVKDKELEEDMKNDPKERAEHVMLVDLARNDVGRVAKFGSVKVISLMGVERYSRVMHLSSEIQAELDDSKTGFDLVRAATPVGTVSGAPKVEAMKLINKYEPERRGPYSGSTGYFSYSGNILLAINIRMIVIIGKKASLQAGGGIVVDSDGVEEEKETRRKASAGLTALGVRPTRA